MEGKKGWKAELTDVLGRCVQSQDKNLWIANILNLVEQELDKAREEGYDKGWSDCERFHILLDKQEDSTQEFTKEDEIELERLQKELYKLNK